MDNLIPGGGVGYSICGHSNFMSCYGNTGVVSPAAGFYLVLCDFAWFWRGVFLNLCNILFETADLFVFIISFSVLSFIKLLGHNYRDIKSNFTYLLNKHNKNHLKYWTGNYKKANIIELLKNSRA